MKRKRGAFLKIVLDYFENNPYATNTEACKTLGVQRSQLRAAFMSLEKKGNIKVTYDDNHMRCVEVVENPEREQRESSERAKQLYEWKQIEYFKNYMDGRSLVLSSAVNAKDRIKQNDINFKLLSKIDDPIILEMIGDNT